MIEGLARCEVLGQGCGDVCLGKIRSILGLQGLKRHHNIRALYVFLVLFFTELFYPLLLFLDFMVAGQCSLS